MDTKFTLPPTSTRVELNTRELINEKLDLNTVRNLRKYKNANKEKLTARLNQLDKEWDSERVFQTKAALLLLSSTLLGFRKHSYWFILTGLVSFFLLEHGIQKWCPPLEIIRKFGFRSADEVNEEKMAVKLFRGDFGELDETSWKIMRTIEKE